MILELRHPLTIPLDLEGVLPEALRGSTIRDAAMRAVLHGNRNIELGELFKITPTGHDSDQCDLTFEGDLSHARNLGMGMRSGQITVKGHAGWHAGARMTGGTLLCENAGHWLGAEMSGGHIHVASNAGDQVGAAYGGSRKGMSGGRIVIHGSAGNELGLRMRRGIIEVAGPVGRFAGASMIAGTIVTGTSLGAYAGAGMKRGTIITASAVQPSAGFVASCKFRPPFLPVLSKELFIDRTVFEGVTVHCLRGDLITGGRGEIWEILK